MKIVWSREEDIQHDVYRPYYYDRFTAGFNAQDQLVAYHHRVTASSILARWAPPAFVNGLDEDAINGAAKEMPYAIPNILVDYVRDEPPGLTTGWWRGVGPTPISSSSRVSSMSSPRQPRKIRSNSAAHCLEVSRGCSACSISPPRRQVGVPSCPKGWDVASRCNLPWEVISRQIAEVEVSKEGEVKVRRVVCAVDCGQIVNPDTIIAQIEGGTIFGLGAALWSEVTLKGGRVEQHNFNDYRVLRINEAPKIEVYLVKNSEAPGGIGEPGTVGIAPAVTNAIFAVTGKRIRKLPIKDQLRPA